MAKHGNSLQALLLEEAQERDGRDQDVSVAKLMDPLYLEARLVDARARRAEAIKRRGRTEASTSTLAFPVSSPQATSVRTETSAGGLWGAIGWFGALAQSPLALRVGVPVAVFAIGLISGATIMWHLAGTDRAPARTAGALDAIAPKVVQASLYTRPDTPSTFPVPAAPSASIEAAWPSPLVLGDPLRATETGTSTRSNVVWVETGLPQPSAAAPEIAMAWIGSAVNYAELPVGVPPTSGPTAAVPEFSRQDRELHRSAIGSR